MYKIEALNLREVGGLQRETKEMKGRKDILKKKIYTGWWLTPLVPVLERQRHAIFKFKASQDHKEKKFCKQINGYTRRLVWIQA